VSDYLSDEEQVAVLKKWWDENGKALLLGLGVAVLSVVGWRYYQDYSQTQAEAAAALYQAYREQREAEAPAPDELARLAEALETDHPGSGYRIFVLFQLSADAVAGEDYELAREHLSTAVAAADDARLGDIARIRLARVLQQLGLSDAALKSLSEVRGEGFFSEVAELKGDILLAQGDRQGATEAYIAARNVGGGAANPLLEMKVLDMAETSGNADTSDAKDAPVE
jgi:predicted negative regulator of RcsB-dependent stress response